MGLHMSLEFTWFCAGVVALFANERLLSTVNQLFSSVCECFLKRLDVFMHTLDSKFRYMINITLPKWFHSSPGWDSERGHCFLTKEYMSWTFTILRMSTSTTPTIQLTSSSSMIGRMQKRLTTMWWGERAVSSTSMRTSTTCPPSPATFFKCLALI